MDTTLNLDLRQNAVDGIEYGAIFDIHGKYRYALWRSWSVYHPRIVFILLNPSTANEYKNDPTIRRCMGFARAWKFGSIEVVNLFAYRATNYRDLFNVSDPVGAENNRFIMQAVERCSTVVLSWGTRGTLLDRDRQVMSLLAGRNDLYCLGITKNGQPRHPLYVKGNACLVAF
ncbi:MAG: DUF1643 domain-containing protein [Ktedonobacteraceae bacterium]